MSLHYLYHHAVDDHNNCRHSPISFEENWATKHWPDRVFGFILAITEVNTKKIIEFFQNDCVPIPILHFRRQLAMELLKNDLDGVFSPLSSPSARFKKPKYAPSHELLKVPNFGGKYDGTGFAKVTTKWLQQSCGCGKCVRTYCKCNKEVILCVDCYAKHILVV